MPATTTNGSPKRKTRKAADRMILNGAQTIPTTDEELGSLLARLGKLKQDHSTFAFEGEQTIGPAVYEGDPENFRGHINSWADDQKQETEFTKNFTCLYGDGAAAIAFVCNEIFGGFTGKRTMFSLPSFSTIKTGPKPDDEMQVPTGLIEIPMLRAEVYLQNDNGMFAVYVKTTKANQSKIQGFLSLVEDRVREASIYKGKSLIVGDDWDITFLDMQEIDEDAVFYNDKIRRQISANVWTMIEHRDEVIAQGLDLKNTILLHGPYGCGKSLALMLSAHRANAAGWTYVQVNANQSLHKAYEVAKMMAPCVFAVEDFDVHVKPDAIGSSLMLDLLDGTSTKGKEMINIFTTNHIDVLQEGQLRMGRTDAMIHVDKLDRDKMQMLVERQLGDLNGIDDWDSVLDEMKWMVPAYVAGCVKKAKLYAIEGRHSLITTSDLLNAAYEGRDQHCYQEKASSYDHNSGVGVIEKKILELVHGEVTSSTKETGTHINLVKGQSEANGRNVNAVGERVASVEHQVNRIAKVVMR